MNIKQLKEKLEHRLRREGWRLNYHEEEETLRIENEKKHGVNLSLSTLLSNYEKKKDVAIDEAVRYIEVTLQAMKKEIQLKGNEKNIFPVIRSTSFPTETKSGKQLLYDEHTSETAVFYSADAGEYYTLIDEETANKEGLSKREIKELAQFNLRSLKTTMKEDKVAGNTFYFINTNDGYDASKILHTALLEKMKTNAEGQLAVAVPHQDVLIFADVTNDTGFDVLAQVVFQFYSQGKIPITALPFLYENGELEPIFILAERKK